MLFAERGAALAARGQKFARLVERIRSEAPQVEPAQNDWELACALRQWAHLAIRRQPNHASLLDVEPAFNFYGRDVAEIFEAFENDRAGVLGCGAGLSFIALLEAFGIQALLLNCGWQDSPVTRMTVACLLQSEDRPIWSIQDVDNDFTLTTAEGEPIDLRDTIKLLNNGQQHDVRRWDGPSNARRLTILQASEDLEADWTIAAGEVPVRVLPDGRQVYRCNMTMAKYAMSAEMIYDHLQRQGLPRNLLYLVTRVFSAYPPGPHAEALLDDLASLTVPTEDISYGPLDRDGSSPVIGPAFDLEAYRNYGLFVVRNFFTPDEIGPIVSAWAAFYAELAARGREIGARGYTPQDLSEPAPEPIARLYRHPKLLELVKGVFGPDIALYQQRVLIKDEFFPGGVAPHQDCGYNRGGLDKLGMFIPLTPCTHENGGLRYLLGSHKLGYLGDQGYVPFDRMSDGTVAGFPISAPRVNPGDIIVMHHCTLHFSYNATSSAPRVYANPYYQSAADSSGAELLAGEWKTDVWWAGHAIADVFRTNTQILQDQLVAARQAAGSIASIEPPPR